MKKATRSLGIAALALSLLAFVGFIVILLMRDTLSSLITSNAFTLVFILPAANLIKVLGGILTALFTFLTAANRKVGIWPEILMIILIIIAVPFISGLAATMQTTITGMHGAEVLSSLSVLSSLTAYAANAASLAQLLSLAVCGMSIAYKKLAPPEAPAYPWRQM